MTKTKKIIAAVAAAAVLATAGILWTNHVKEQTAADIKAKTEAETTLVTDAQKFLSESHTKKEREDKLLDTFKQLNDKEKATDLTDAYIYGAWAVAQNTQLSDDDTNLLTATLDSEDKLHTENLTDDTLKKTISSMEDQCVTLRYVNGQIFWDVNYQYFIDAFGDYLREDYLDTLRFYELEKTESYVDQANDVLNYDVVYDRLDRSYALYDKYKDSDLNSVLKSNYDFYKAVLFGGYYQTYIWSDSAEIKDDAKAAWTAYADKSKDPDMKPFIEKITKELEDVGGTRTIGIMDEIKKFCDITDSTGQSSNSAQVTESDAATGSDLNFSDGGNLSAVGGTETSPVVKTTAAAK